MSIKVRKKIVDETTTLLKDINHFIFANYKGVSAAALSHLRSQLMSKNIRMRVVKNSTTAIALDRVSKKQAASLLSGQTAVFYGADDPVILSKELVSWSVKNKALKLLGGYSEGTILAPQDLVKLSKLPVREAMLAITLGTLKAPCTNLASALAAVLRKLLYAVNEIENKQPKS